MLREFARKVYANKAGGGAPITGEPAHGTLTDVELHLKEPIYGEVNGVPVTIIGQGNMQGFSPVSWCVEQFGENAWLPTDAVLITDPRFAPLPVAHSSSSTAR